MSGASTSFALAAALPLAWALDAAFGEPRDAWHPVAWLGRVAMPLGERLRQAPPHLARGGGALVWLLGASLLGGLWVAGPPVAPARRCMHRCRRTRSS